MKFNLFILLLLQSYISNAQLNKCYYQLTDYAFIKYQEERFFESAKLYECAFLSVNDTLPHHLKFAGIVYSHLGDNEKALYYLEKAVDRGIELDHIHVSQTLQQTPNWMQFKNQYLEKRNEYLSTLSLEKTQ